MSAPLSDSIFATRRSSVRYGLQCSVCTCGQGRSLEERESQNNDLSWAGILGREGGRELKKELLIFFFLKMSYSHQGAVGFQIAEENDTFGEKAEIMSVLEIVQNGYVHASPNTTKTDSNRFLSLSYSLILVKQT